MITSRNQVNKDKHYGLSRYWIGRLLDSYLQTYLNNLAMK